jgi:hypothetical protein
VIVVLAVLWSGASLAGEPLADFSPNPLRPPTGKATTATVDLPAPIRAPEEVTPHRIPPFEIQCRAAERSAIARLLGNERRAVPQPTSTLHRKRDTEARIAMLRREVLALAADEARNRDAGTALVAYWKLAEAERSLGILAGAIAVADQAIADHHRLTARGLELPTSPEKLLTRRLSVDDASLAADTARRSLVVAIQEMTDLAGSDIGTDPPAADIDLADDPPDVAALVAEGMALRPELKMLRLLERNLDAETVGVARKVLAQASPLLGGSETKTMQCLAWLTERRATENLPAVRRELQVWTRDREKTVAAEISVAALECSGTRARVAIARQQLALEELMANDLRKRLSVGESDALAIHIADLDVMTAKRAVLEREVSWELARVKLLQSRGLLAAQCERGHACAPGSRGH